MRIKGKFFNRLFSKCVFFLGLPLSVVVFFIYGLETVVSVLFTNARTRLPYNEREISNTARTEAECSIENFEFIVW